MAGHGRSGPLDVSTSRPTSQAGANWPVRLVKDGQVLQWCLASSDRELEVSERVIDGVEADDFAGQAKEAMNRPGLSGDSRS